MNIILLEYFVNRWGNSYLGQKKLFTLAILVILALQILCLLTLNPLGMLAISHELYPCLTIFFGLYFNISYISCWESYFNFSAGRYRVFLGHKQYFVSSDVGAGKMQWYAFHKEPPGGVDSPNGMCSWCVQNLTSVWSTASADVKFSAIYL